MGVQIVALSEQLFSNTRPLLLTLWGGVACVLLIGCLNIANLLLVRASSRRQEISIRAALGASRARLIAMLLTESVLLGLAGGMGGLAFAYVLVPLLLRLVPESSSLPRLDQVGLDADVFLFTLLLSVATAIFFGLMPAIGASRLNLHETFKESGRTGTAGRGIGRLRGALVVIEVALCLILLVGAGLSIRSFRQLTEAELGYRSSGLLTFQVNIPAYKYQPGLPRVRLYQELTSHLSAMPGVQSVGLAHVFPGTAPNDIEIEGQPVYDVSQVPKAAYRVINAAYFPTLELPLKAGRFFNEQDTDKSLPVTVISDSMARQFWPGQDPIGKRIRRGRAEGAPWLSIVGIVGDVRQRTAIEGSPEFYLPFTQLPPWYAMTFLVRTSIDPFSIAPAIRSDLARFDPDLPLEHMTTMATILDEEIWRPRFSMVLSAIFGSVSLFLAAAGVYGVLSFLVTARTREMGIRIALGATHGDVKKLVIGYGLRLGMAGLGTGAVILFCLAHLLQHFLYGFQPANAAARTGARPDVQVGALLYGVEITDPAIFATVFCLLLTVTVLACYIPARRATRDGTLNALRSD
jgi:putative ABC transport system permease protein